MPSQDKPGVQSSTASQISTQRPGSSRRCSTTRLPVLLCKGDIPKLLVLRLAYQVMNTHMVPQMRSQELFSQTETIISWVSGCTNLVDMGFLVDQHLLLTQRTQLQSGRLLDAVDMMLRGLMSKYDNHVGEQEHIMRLLRVANVSNYLECSETEKMATDILNTPSFKLQKEEVLCIYKHIFKPLFEKKSLSKLYSKLVPMVVWVVMVNPCDSAGESVVFDICKKINIFLLYDKTKEDKIEPIKVFNLCLRLLSLKPDRGEAIQLRNLSCILNYFSEVNLSKYVETWRQAKNKYSAAEIENVFRNLLKSGCIKFYLSVIYEITLQLKESGDYKTLYHLFTRFIRADFASSKCMPQLEKYLRILQIYMVGFINYDRLDVEELQSVTDVVLQTLTLKKEGLTEAVSFFLLRIYSIYQLRFQRLGPKSMLFFRELKNFSNTRLSANAIEERIAMLSFRGVDFNYKGEGLWDTSNRYRGIRNLGNTCYINSFLQSLYMTKQFRKLVLEWGDIRDLPCNIERFFSLLHLFQELGKKELGESRQVDPSYFRYTLPAPFNDSVEQQDVMHFIREYMESLLKDLQKVNLNKKVQKLTYYQITQLKVCKKCHETTTKMEEPSFDLILNLDPADPQIMVSNLLKKHFNPEAMERSNQLQCYNCRTRQDCIIYRSPHKCGDVLVLTIAIFEYRQGESRKVMLPFALEESIDFKLIFQNFKGQYDLYAFIVHIGQNATSGHYVAYARNLEENETLWYRFDDGYVAQKKIETEKDFDFMDSEKPYILFYSIRK